MSSTPEVDLDKGVYRPVAEETTVTELQVTGTIPKDLNGRWLRNGPNPATLSFAGNDIFSWFVGDGMVHSVHLEDGKALGYRNRWVRTKSYDRSSKERTGEAEGVEGDTPANTNVIGLADQYLALCEGGVPYQLSADLETVGPQNFGGSLPGGHMSAHPKFDAHTGQTIAFDYDWQEPYGRYFIFDENGTITHQTQIPVAGPTMMHDFATTATRTVFMDLPIVFDIQMAMKGLPIPYRWNDEYAARIGVLGRDATGDTTQWFEIEPCYIFHTMNAFDDGDRVVLDAVRYDKLLEFDFESGSFIPDTDPGILTRYELNLTSGHVSETTIATNNIDFPRTAEQRLGRRYQTGYAVEFKPDLFGSRGLVRFDLATGDVVRWVHDPEDAVGEPLFVPRQGADPQTESDGYVLAPVYRAEQDRSALEIRDADDLTGSPVATVEIPTRIPAGFHGNWIPLG